MVRSVAGLIAGPLALALIAWGCGDDGSDASGSDDGSTAATGDGATTLAADDSTSTPATDSIDDTAVGDSTGEEPADLPPPSCAPTGGGPYWLLEGESMQATIECTTGIDLDARAVTIDPLPDGAVFDAPTATLSWTPGLDQGATYELTVTALQTGESTILKIGVVDRWDDPDNVPVVDPTVYTEEYGLPVLHLQVSPEITDDGYTPATTTYRGHTYDNEAKLRGAASLWYPKNSYTLKFTKEDKFGDPDAAGGFVDKRKIVLISTFDDNAYVRQRLAYELWNLLDPGHIQIQVYSGVVFLDGQYFGLYTIADHVDRYLMEDHDLAQEGNLYKARTHDANFRVAGKPNPHQGLTKEEGLPIAGQPGAFDDLDAFVTFVATASDAEFDAQIDTIADRRDYENWWIFVTLIMGDDSVGKNSYHYHDPLGGPWRFAPWDFNDSFGQTWQTARKDHLAEPESYTYRNEFFVRLLDSSTFGAPLRSRYGAELADPYAVDSVLERYDAMVDQTALSALRDESRWATEYQNYGGWNWRNDFTSYDDEVEYVRQWIIDRWAYVGSIY